MKKGHRRVKLMSFFIFIPAGNRRAFQMEQQKELFFPADTIYAACHKALEL